jgi:leucyl/phenylalanyl-tRNA--protein transferase
MEKPFRLPLDVFPDPNRADKEGLIAYGGDLSPEMLLSAYVKGIFPWFSAYDPILWWSPDPRLILYPSDLKVSRSLRQTMNKQLFEVKTDVSFRQVIYHCAEIKRKDQDSTWITPQMQQAYVRLHEMGYAHSVETYLDGKLVGGLYGLTLGKVFCGESMFTKVSDASKVAFYHLVQRLISLDYAFIDAQTPTNHLKSLGAVEMQREQFLKLLDKYISLDIYW